MLGKKLLVDNVTIGADIEVFLENISSKEIISAEGIIKGTKEHPFKFKDDNDYFGTSLDNVMAEFCIPPARDIDDFHSNIQYALEYIKSILPREIRPIALPAARLDSKYLLTENAQLFGCEPDFNAWLMGDMNEKPTAAGNLRSCGGHIHVGYADPQMDISMCIVRAMDIFLGLPSIIQEPDNERKSLYGKAGAFRFKDYGVEYRTISNYYINSEILTNWAFNNTLEAIKFVNNDKNISYEEGHAVSTAINSNDKTLAKTMCEYFNVKLAA